MRKKILITTTSGIMAFLLIGASMQGMALERDKVEKPQYQVIEEREGYELREYNAYIRAEVDLDGSEKNAMNRGFRPLANYIFGGNTENQKIEMTSPVTQGPAPIFGELKSLEEVASSSDLQEDPQMEEKHTVSFIMPSEYTLDALPTPNNESLRLVEVPTHTVAAIRFSGWGANGTMHDKHEKLISMLEADGIEVLGKPLFARYDPPWTLPFFRRNEVLVPVSFNPGK